MDENITTSNSLKLGFTQLQSKKTNYRVMFFNRSIETLTISPMLNLLFIYNTSEFPKSQLLNAVKV